VTDRRLLYGALAAAALVALFFLLRPNEDSAQPDERAATTATAATTTDSAPTATTAPAPPTVTKPKTTRWLVDSRDERLDRLSVARGERVRLVAIADVRDHIHLHGYDLFADVAPGRPAVLQFVARITGRFEIELEDRGRLIAQLTVRP
jgi:hypothetical protein